MINFTPHLSTNANVGILVTAYAKLTEACYLMKK